MTPPSLRDLPTEISYVALLFALFVVPRILVRWRLPTAVTSVALGAVCGMGLGLFAHDPTIELLSTFGIVSLFLFAGLEVDFVALRLGAAFILQHLLLRVALLAGAAWALGSILGLAGHSAWLVALALLTPSTGFILNALDRLELNEQERFWIGSKAIATELLALAVLFVTLQSTTALNLGLSAIALLAMILLVPVAFRAFAAWVVPHAPKSEFAFLILVAVLCALATLSLGVYYLVGAFVVGMAAQSFRKRLPALASEQMLHAVESFASIFVPFYFFHAGLLLRREDFGTAALLAGGVFLVTMVPVRLLAIGVHRRFTLGESLHESLKVSVPMLPTLVFTLVIAQILRERFDAPPYLFGGLIVYTLVNTLIPGFVLHTPPPEFEEPHMLPLDWGKTPDEKSETPNPSDERLL